MRNFIFGIIGKFIRSLTAFKRSQAAYLLSFHINVGPFPA